MSIIQTLKLIDLISAFVKKKSPVLKGGFKGRFVEDTGQYTLPESWPPAFDHLKEFILVLVYKTNKIFAIN